MIVAPSISMELSGISWSRHDDSARAAAFFFFNATATPEIYTLLYTLSLHDALPISDRPTPAFPRRAIDRAAPPNRLRWPPSRSEEHTSELQSHSNISYAVFCLK